ncbi:MAG: hypothetical protein M3Q32_07685, partial [Pseudomonadota bacterium]|nr:hypothetical protein [Pseudomonadota bacterium]
MHAPWIGSFLERRAGRIELRLLTRGLTNGRIKIRFVVRAKLKECIGTLDQLLSTHTRVIILLSSRANLVTDLPVHPHEEL